MSELQRPRSYRRSGESLRDFSERILRGLHQRLTDETPRGIGNEESFWDGLVAPGDQMYALVSAIDNGTLDSLLDDESFVEGLPENLKAAVASYRSGESECDVLVVEAGKYVQEAWRRESDAYLARSSRRVA